MSKRLLVEKLHQTSAFVAEAALLRGFLCWFQVKCECDRKPSLLLYHSPPTMSRSRPHPFCEMAIAGGGLGVPVQQLQPPAAPETVPQLTVVSWKFLMIDSVQHVEWTVNCKGMKGIANRYPDLWLCRGNSFLSKRPLFNVSDVDGQYTFQAPFDQKELYKSRHDLQFWCVVVALMKPFCDLPLPMCHNPTGCPPEKRFGLGPFTNMDITLSPGNRFLC
jgi:hypothetical protein